MLNQLNIDNINSIKEVQSIFCDVFKQKDELINTLTANPYVKLCTYSVDKKIVAFIEYEEIYDRYELDNIFVLEEYRNMGLASYLMQYMIDEGKKNNIKNITLEVRRDNDKAIRLYKKYGFIEKAIRHNYYGNCDGILMEKEMM